MRFIDPFHTKRERKISAGVAITLVVMMGLSALNGVLAAPTATPTPTPTPTPVLLITPGKSGDGDTGTGKGTGDNGTGQGKGNQGESQPTDGKGDNIPIEVEVDPELDADLKPKKNNQKIWEKTVVWTFMFVGAEDSSPNVHIPIITENYILNFQATKVEGAEMHGSYTGEGYLQSIGDTSAFVAQSQGAFLQMDMAWEGSLSDVAFELKASYAEPHNDDKLAPLAPAKDVLAPLAPGGKPVSKHSGEAQSSMTWASQLSSNFLQTPLEGRAMHEATPPQTLSYFIYGYPNGKAEISLYGTTAQKSYLTFWGTLSKKISWREVK